MNLDKFFTEIVHQDMHKMPTELEQLKRRIDASKSNGIKTSIIRSDYKPTGDLMMFKLCDNREYVQMRVSNYGPGWYIFSSKYKPNI